MDVVTRTNPATLPAPDERREALEAIPVLPADAVLAILRGGREVVLWGWNKWSLKRPQGHCALGAIGMKNGSARLTVRVAHGYLLAEARRRGATSVASYNDRWRVRKHDVLSLFDQAIAARRRDLVDTAQPGHHWPALS
jgi:hypothetical protein